MLLGHPILFSTEDLLLPASLTASVAPSGGPDPVAVEVEVMGRERGLFAMVVLGVPRWPHPATSTHPLACSRRPATGLV